MMDCPDISNLYGAFFFIGLIIGALLLPLGVWLHSTFCCRKGT